MKVTMSWLTGLMTMTFGADIMVAIDADFQDDVNIIEDMIDKCYVGNDIVYGLR